MNDMKRKGNSHTSSDDEYLDRFYKEFWDHLSATDGDTSSLSSLQRDALCLYLFQTETYNGGLFTFFENSSGDYASEVPDVLRRIGAAAAARVLEEALNLFGSSGLPIDRAARLNALEALSSEARDRIDQLTDEYYDLEDQGLSLSDLFDAYVLARRPPTT